MSAHLERHVAGALYDLAPLLNFFTDVLQESAGSAARPSGIERGGRFARLTGRRAAATLPALENGGLNFLCTMHPWSGGDDSET